MLFTKLKIKHGENITDFGWVLKCRGAVNLLDWYDQYEEKSTALCLVDALGSKNLRGDSGLHCKSRKAEVYAVLLGLEVSRRKEKMTLVQATDFIFSLIIDTKIRLIKEFGFIYIQRIGSVVIPSDDDIVEDEMEFDVFPQNIFTRDDIEVTRFEGGSHFFATVSGVSVVVDVEGNVNGDVKWYSYGEAEQHAINFMNELNKKRIELDRRN